MKAVVAGCILKEDRVYLVKRNQADSPECIGKFEFPGGLVEEGETFEEALVRELKEELEIDVKVLKLLHAQINSYSNSGPYLVLFYLCRLTDEDQGPTSPSQIIYLEPHEVKYWDTLPGSAEAAERLEKKYKEVIDKAGIKQTVEKTSRIISYELGNVHKILIYIEQFGEAGYLGELKIECSDLYTMVCLICEQLGYNLDEIRDMGFERFRYRVKEVEARDLNKANESRNGR